MRSDRSLEAVKKQEPRSARGSIEAMDVDEISIRRIPSLDARRKRRTRTKKLSPQRLRVPPGTHQRGGRYTGFDDWMTRRREFRW